MYKDIYTQPNHRSFGRMVVTIRIVGETATNDRLRVYNESDYTSSTHVGAAIENTNGDLLHG